MQHRAHAFFQIAFIVFAGVFSGVSISGEVCSANVIRMIVPNPPGGTGDLVARMLSEKAGQELGQPIVVENHAGATTTIGTNVVAKARPDGCTMLSMTTSGLVISILRENLPYNLNTDLTPVISVGSFPMVIAVPAGSKITTMKELIEATRSKEGITYGSGGTGSLAHLSSVRLIKELKGTGTHIPFRGNADAMQALLGEQIQVFLPSSAEVLPLVNAGKIRLLAVTSEKRLASLPDTPTTKELGFSDFLPRLWYGFLVPVNTPAASVTRYHQAFSKALSNTQVKDRLTALGFALDIKDSTQFVAFMKSETDRWSKIIKENNISSSD